ncbi:MAG: beta-propeller domain-containing protein, partial [Solirubrobacterales bacterium]
RTLGTNVSLFDVSDLAAPASLDRQNLGSNSHSEAEYDHHAFFFDPASGLLVIGLELYGERPSQSFAGAVGMRVDATGVEEIARIFHPASGGDSALPISRTLLSGGRLYTLSEQGLMAHDPATRANQAFLEFD